MKNIFQIERSKPGWMSREEVLSLRRLKADGIELMQRLLHDCSPEYLKEVTKDAGVPITCTCFSPPGVPTETVVAGSINPKLLDRTAAMRTPALVIVPGISSRMFPSDQQAWMIEGLRVVQNMPQSIGVTSAGGEY